MFIYKSKTIIKKIINFTVSSLLSITMMSLMAMAQSGTTVVRGTVTDHQSQAIAGAVVTLTNTDKNFSRKQITGNDGSYVFSSLQPGTYSIEVTSNNFKKLSIGGIAALVDTIKVVDGHMEVGNVSETLTISSLNEAILNTEDATLGNAIENRRIIEMPLNGRNIVGLLSLQAGVTRQGEVNGGRRDQANITIDGIDANEQQTGLDIVTSGGSAFTPGTTAVMGNAFSSVLRMSPDSVQEFRVTTSNPSATQGRSSGAQISLVTKSGTNEFHGSLYHFHRNTVTTANDWFNNALGRDENGKEIAKRPKLIRNIFGGSIGAPIIKDRLFFFFNYEGRRDAAEQSVLRNVPTESLRQGIVKYRNTEGGITTLTPADIARIYGATGGVNPNGLAILQTAPLPNDFTIGDGLNRAGYRFNAPISTKLNASVLRLDYTANDKHSLSFRGNYQEDLYGGAPAFPGTPASNFWVHPKGFATTHTWSVTNSLVNNARVGITRASLSTQGDNNATSIAFRDVYSPFLNSRKSSRTLPVWNIVDDATWIKNSHTVQIGTNLRFVRNNSVSYANSYDNALVNFQFYTTGGSSLLAPVSGTLDSDFRFEYGRAIASALGRFSQYSINSIYDKSGKTIPVGTPASRNFATDEYEFYGQDSWKMRPTLTLTYGLRWSLNTPVYESNGFQLVPSVNLGDFLQRRADSAYAGTPLNELISYNLGGKANNGEGIYAFDKNNFAPNISVAWSPNFGDNILGKVIGRNGKSVIRAGFRMLFDRIGSQLAVSSESENSFGFSASSTNSSSFTNTTTRLGPLVTVNPNVRAFPGVIPPRDLTFPLAFPADESTRILAGIDQSITSPRQYSWNLTYGRELPKGFSFEIGYIGRAARNLLLNRDVMQLNNLRDPKSGQDWYTAAGILSDLRNSDTPLSTVPTMPYFNNLFPNLGSYLAEYFGEPELSVLTPSQAAYFLHSNITDWTAIQEILDDGGIHPNAFFHPQYAALQTLSTVGRSNYHSGFLTLRQRFGRTLSFDFNYTYSKSLDNASTLETQRILSTSIRNALNPDLEYAVSDFDVRHNFNANWLLELPFGKGQKFFNNPKSIVDGIIGGWQLTGITRFNTGLPAGTPSDLDWATNWQLQSDGVPLRPVKSSPNSNVNGKPNLFSDPLAAYRSFRNARAGETGVRNLTTIRFPRYFVLDAGLGKNFKITEGTKLQFRWEVFNVTNSQPFGTLAALSLNPEPFKSTATPPDFGRFIGSQAQVGETRSGRIMQFGLRLTF